jgi:hypothetical protein
VCDTRGDAARADHPAPQGDLPLPGVSSGEANGSCRIGSRDLAERLVMTGYVRRLDAADGARGRVPPI